MSFYSVKDYGACGNGTANDTAAIQAAIDAASLVKGTVLFPGNSTYLVSRGANPWCLKVDTDIRILGEQGAVVKLATANLADGSEILRINSAPGSGQLAGVVVEGLTFDGNAIQSGTGLRCVNVVNTIIKRNRFKSFSALNAGTFAYAMRVEGNVATPPNPFIWAATAPANFSRGVRVVENIVESGIPNGGGQPNGIFCYECDGIIISANVLSAAGLAIMIFGPTRLATIAQNEVYDAQDNGIRVNLQNANDVSAVRDITITGNIVRNSVVDGIRLNGIRITCTANVSISNGNSGIRADVCRRSTIAANVCNDNLNRGIMLAQAGVAGFGGHESVTISDNQCIGNAGDGIFVQGGGDTGAIPAKATKIAGNVCLQNGTTGSGWAGIKVWDADAKTQIIGNTCGENGAPGADAAGIALTAAVLSWGGATVAFNRCHGLVTGVPATARQPFGIWMNAVTGLTLSKNYLYFNDCSDTPDTTASFGAAVNTAVHLSGGTVNGQFLAGTLYRSTSRGVNRAATAGVDLTANDVIVAMDESGLLSIFGPNTRLAHNNVATLTDAATIAVDASLSDIFTVTLGANRTMGLPTNPEKGQRITFIILQDATGGRTLGWNAVFKVSWSNTGNTASKRSMISFVYDGTNWNQDGAQTPYI